MIYRDGNFNPRSPWGERPAAVILWYIVTAISIHALREESDLHLGAGMLMRLRISIHALREESDCRKRHYPYCKSNFNPRSPWGERQACRLRGAGNTQHFNPRSPWGERQCGRARCVSCIQFQSTLSVRRATVSHRYYARHARFQSTLSVRRATEYIKNDVLVLKISIHALREESDRLLF